MVRRIGGSVQGIECWMRYLDMIEYNDAMFKLGYEG